MLRKILIALLAALLLPGCTPATYVPTAVNPPVTLTVMAASSLTESFTELGGQFESAHPGVRVQFNFAGSQQLAQQLSEGAPADVFASANTRQMEVAVQSGRIDSSQVRQFARNRLVIITPSRNPAGLQSWQDLARPGLKLVLAAQAVPAGQYALTFLDSAAKTVPGLREAVLANVVSYEENVKSVLMKVEMDEADGGIVFLSDARGKEDRNVNTIEIPAELNVTAQYPAAVIANSAQPALAQAFVDLLLSENGQAVLEQHGLVRAAD